MTLYLLLYSVYVFMRPFFSSIGAFMNVRLCPLSIQLLRHQFFRRHAIANFGSHFEIIEYILQDIPFQLID